MNNEFKTAVNDMTKEEMENLIYHMYGYTEAKARHDQTEEQRSAARALHDSIIEKAKEIKAEGAI